MTSPVNSEGFEILPEYFDRNTVEALIRDLESSQIGRSRAGMRHALEVDAVRSLAFDPRLIQLSTNVLGSHAVPFRATLFDKSSVSNWLVVWHQDTALPLRERLDINGWGPWSVKEGVICARAPRSALEQILAIRVHLDDSTTENGPLKVLRRSHTLGILSDDAIQKLTARTSAIECHTGSGGLLLMKPLLVHASSKARNGMQRRVLHIEYSATTRFDGGLQLALESP